MDAYAADMFPEMAATLAASPEQIDSAMEAWGMAMALQSLAWGIAQPLAGAMADRYGTARVVIAGLLVYAAGLALMVVSPSGSMLNLTAGVITGVGIASSSFSIVMIAFGRNVPQEKRSLVFGVATAASSFGQFIFAPIGQAFISGYGWQTALLYAAVLLALVIPLTFALRGRTERAAGQADLKFMQALSRAWGFGSYRLLVIGFFVCGFHLAFVNVHMPAYLVQCGLPPEVGSWSQAGGLMRHGYAGGGWRFVPRAQWPEDEDGLRTVMSKWSAEVGDCRQELVFIGQNIDFALLRRELDDCLLTDAELAAGPEDWLRLPDPFGAWTEEAA